MWIVIYVAYSKEIAEAIENLLKDENILYKTKSVYKNMDPKENYYEILVPQSEATEAHSILMESGY